VNSADRFRRFNAKKELAMNASPNSPLLPEDLARSVERLEVTLTGSNDLVIERIVRPRTETNLADCLLAVAETSGFRDLFFGGASLRAVRTKHLEITNKILDGCGEDLEVDEITAVFVEGPDLVIPASVMEQSELVG
jgi:hypothetical protein